MILIKRKNLALFLRSKLHSSRCCGITHSYRSLQAGLATPSHCLQRSHSAALCSPLKTGLGSLHSTSARAGVHVFPKRIGKHEGPATPPAVALQTHRAIQLSLSPHRPSRYQEYKTDKTRHVIFYLPHSIFLNLSLLLLTLQANTKMTRLNL